MKVQRRRGVVIASYWHAPRHMFDTAYSLAVVRLEDGSEERVSVHGAPTIQGEILDLIPDNDRMQVLRVKSLDALDAYPRFQVPDLPRAHERHFRPHDRPRPESPGHSSSVSMKPITRDERGSRAFRGGS